jgi:hypothetical protein
LKLSNSLIINPSCPHLSGPPEISHPPYLPNGDRLGKINAPLASKPSKMGGRSPQNPKKKTQFWWGHTCNPKP